MKRKQIERTCRGCGQSRFVPTQLKDLTIQKQPGNFGRLFMSAQQVNQMATENALALSMIRCAGCGSTSYKDKQVRH